MSQQTKTILLRGGLDLVTPQITMPDGRAIAALNYEPDDIGYSSLQGYERYDGRTSPSSSTDPTTIAALRAAIGEIPGSGPVRGVVVYAGSVWGFRDSAGGGGAGMYKATPTGWVAQTFGSTLDFNTGAVEFTEGETITGGTSGATATVKRVVTQSGTYNGSAAGYVVLSNIVGTFVNAENLNGSIAGAAAAKAFGSTVAIALQPGGVYSFVVHNFYGAAASPRLYLANGVTNAFEWDGTTLAPIETGIDTSSSVDILLTAGGPPDRVLTSAGDRIIMAEISLDNPAFLGVYRNHLFLGYSVGAMVFSGPGEPLQYRALDGAGTFSFGEAMTNMVVASSSLIVTGRNRISYVAGNDIDDFQLLELTITAGAVINSMQVYGETPIYLDDGGIRKLTASAAYGDFKSGSVTQLVELLFRQKREASIAPSAAMIVKSKDQYRLFWTDGSGAVIYMGRKAPEMLPFLLPNAIFCTGVGEISAGQGDRLFAGSATNGYVFEIDKGTSFDGSSIDTYLRLAFNQLDSPTYRKAFHSYRADVVCADPITVGTSFDVDYASGQGGPQSNDTASEGMPIVTTAANASVDWTQVTQGELVHYLYGIGRNVAVRHVTSSSTAAQHSFASATFNFAWRGLVR